MEISRMSMGIIKIINRKYSEYINDYLDIKHIKNICELYKFKQNTNNSIGLSEINFSTPDFKKSTNDKKNKNNQAEILKSHEFIKKYAFFIRIIYACLKIDVNIFDIKNNIITLKNNYLLIKALELKKKELLVEHINTLKNQYRNISQKISIDYESYYENYLMKIKIIDKISGSIGRLIKLGVFEKTDNLLTLILPYFYTYSEYIEEYN